MLNTSYQSAFERDLSPVHVPEDGRPPSETFVHELQERMLAASRHPSGPAALQQVLPPRLLDHIIKQATAVVTREPTVVELNMAANKHKVTVVGDTHGQFHDLCCLFKSFGDPNKQRIYIFNGDYVDRGAWGVETLTLLLAWKWVLPNNVYLIRGNHETSFCTKHYGFWAELKAKYGKAGMQLYKDAIKLFAHLPLAAVIANTTLILHGGLFRAVNGKRDRRGKEATYLTLRTGTLDDLREASKGSADPDPDRSLRQLIASDVLWSDPSPHQGHKPNELRGVGTIYGPDITEAFLSHNKLKLIIRSHEGPDARDKRAADEKMPDIHRGYCVDHDCPSGLLVTLFSAPDYPQFMAEGEERYRNKAAVLHLCEPDYATPTVESYEAQLPRPHAESYYDISGFSEDEDDDVDEEAGHAGNDEDKQARHPVAQNTVSQDTTTQPAGAASGEARDPAESQASRQQQPHQQPECTGSQHIGRRQQQQQATEASDLQAADGSKPQKLPAPLSPQQQQHLTMHLQHPGQPSDADKQQADAQEPEAVADTSIREAEELQPAVKRHKAVHTETV